MMMMIIIIIRHDNVIKEIFFSFSFSIGWIQPPSIQPAKV